MSFLTSMFINPTSLTDSYNGSHFKLYPPETTEISGYFESRSDSIFPNISFFGFQYYLKEYLCLVAKNIKHVDLDVAENRWNTHGLPFNREGWEILKDEYKGDLPLEIQAAPEGAWIPKDNALVQLRNTDPRLYWLPTWTETMLVQSWYMPTVATISKELKLDMAKSLIETGCEDVASVLAFMLHDFGFRGCPNLETACMGGAAHLTNFLGTDTFTALDFISAYYNTDDVVGHSIAASNHAVITSWGRNQEYAAFKNVLDKFLKPGKIVACVSDSYDFWAAIDAWGTIFKDQIMNSGGRLVVRPDSGDPLEVIPKAIAKLMKYFGKTLNSKGFYVLPDCIRMIWGDGIDPATIREVLAKLARYKIAAENICFGMGGALLQKVNRDMGSFAFKVNEVVRDGVRIPIYKDPITGSKVSKPGRQALVKWFGQYRTIPEVKIGSEYNWLEPVYKDGDLLRDYSFSEIRLRAAEGIPC